MGRIKRASLPSQRIPMFQLIQHLEDCRTEQRLSRARLSVRAGYHRNHWDKIVRGCIGPRLSTFCDFAQALGYALDLRKSDA